MLNEKITKLMNKQINEELYSAYLYTYFATYFDHRDLKGFGHWYRVQAKEEFSHAQKFCNYMVNQGRQPELKEIRVPDVKITDFLSLAKAALAHEVQITGLIHKICEAAEDLKDYRSRQFLDWFVAEQAEEEVNACDMVSLLETVEGNRAALYFADAKMAERT